MGKYYKKFNISVQYNLQAEFDRLIIDFMID